MKVDTFKCELCDRQKAEPNHWYMATLIRVDERIVGATITEWATGNPLTVDAHLCGAQHVLEWLSRQLLETSK